MTSHLINFYLFTFLPTDPISFPWCSVEQEINLAWPYLMILPAMYGEYTFTYIPPMEKVCVP